MSLIDPSSRWWNRTRGRQVMAGACWGVALVLGLVAGWSSTGVVGTNGAAAIVLTLASAGALLMLLAGMFLWAFADDSDGVGLRPFVTPLAAFLAVVGLGDVVHALVDDVTVETTGLVFLVAGIVSLVGIEVLVRRLATVRGRQARVEREGRTTTGTVTKAHRYLINYRDVTRVTVRFSDAEGRPRWTRTTVAGSLGPGTVVQVRYLGDEVGRRGAVTVTPL